MISKIQKKEYEKLNVEDAHEEMALAISNGNLEIVEYFCVEYSLKDKVDLGKNKLVGVPFLTLAAQYNQFEIVKFLLDSPKLKHHASAITNGYSALHQAFKDDNLEMGKYLLEKGTNSKRISMIHLNGLLSRSCHKKDLSVIDYLFTIRSAYEYDIPATVIQTAKYGQLPALIYLMKHPVVKQMVLEKKDTKQKMFLEACEEGNTNIIAYMLENMNSNKDIDYTEGVLASFSAKNAEMLLDFFMLNTDVFCDKNIFSNKEIVKLLEYYPEVNKKYNLIVLNKNLDENLTTKKQTDKKIKI